MTLRADTPPVWPFLFVIVTIVYGLFRKRGRRSLPDPPVFALSRALVAHVRGVPHYFVEIDDGGLRSRLVLHLAGKRLRILEPDPAKERDRTFPCSRFVIRPSAQVLRSGRGEYTIDCLGSTVDPLVAKDESWLERIGDSLLTDGVEECDKPFEEYTRLSGSAADPSNVSLARSDATGASVDRSDWRLRVRRALRVDERGRRGPHYYVELDDGGVLHLGGYGLRPLEGDENQARVFPCDTFEPLYPPRSCLEWPEGVNCIGTAFEPDDAGRLIADTDRIGGWVPRDWGRLDKPYPEVLAHFDGRPAPRTDAASPTNRTDLPVEPLRHLAPVQVDDKRADKHEPSQSRRFSALRALRVDERGSRGPHYFVLLTDGKVLHLRGHYLRGYEPDGERERTFPCETFESMDGCPNIFCIGRPFEPEVAGRAIGFADRYEGFMSDNWTLVDKSYEEIRDYFVAEPAPSSAPSPRASDPVD